MNLENEILQLCFDVLEKEITPLEAQKEILRLLDVVEQSEQLVICKKCGSSEMYQYTKTKDKCDDCGNIQDY